MELLCGLSLDKIKHVKQPELCKYQPVSFLLLLLLRYKMAYAWRWGDSLQDTSNNCLLRKLVDGFLCVQALCKNNGKSTMRYRLTSTWIAIIKNKNQKQNEK